MRCLIGFAVALFTSTSFLRAADSSVPPFAPQVDKLIQQRLDAEKIPSSPLAGDAEFLRRAYLDITGVIPPAEKVAAFLDSKDPAKRAKVIDELLASPGYGRHMADIWQGLLFLRTTDTRRLKVDPLVEWLEERFNKNQPWDKLVAELLTATGSPDDNGAVTFFLANQTPDKLTDMTTKLFLGVQLQCAQCHNHPFTGWKQAEYWGMAAFFSKVKSDRNLKKAGKQGQEVSITEGARGKRLPLPESAKNVSPKFLQGDKPTLNESSPYRPVLAKWLTASNNPYFARAMANRTWAQFFARGVVNPVDDMHEGNEPSHPKLLKLLAEQFTTSGFDVKQLIRAICTSQTYQRTSKPAGNEADVKFFSHMAMKPFSPEQLYDSLAQVVGKPGTERARNRKAQQQVKGMPNDPRTSFVAFFDTDDGAEPTEYQGGIPQVLRLMNSPQFNKGSDFLNRVVQQGKAPGAIIEQMYLETLSRRPTPAESQRLAAYVSKHTGDPKLAYSDVLWALLNSSEFTLNH